MFDNFKIEATIDENQNYTSYEATDKTSGDKYLVRKYKLDELTGLTKVEGWEEEFTEMIDGFSQTPVKYLRPVIGGGVAPEDKAPYIVFDWFDGLTAETVLKDKSRLELDEIQEIINNTLTALKPIHEKGLIHAGISPKSLYQTKIEGKEVWALDWDPIRSLRCKHGLYRLGLDFFTAPELIAGGKATVHSDIYAIGKTGEKLAARKVNRPCLAEWISQASANTPDQRFTDVSYANTCLDEQKAEANTPQKLYPEPQPLSSANLDTDSVAAPPATHSVKAAANAGNTSASSLAPTPKPTRGTVAPPTPKTGGPPAPKSLTPAQTALRPEPEATPEYNKQMRVNITADDKPSGASGGNSKTLFIILAAVLLLVVIGVAAFVLL